MFNNKNRNHWTYIIKEAVKSIYAFNFLFVLALINIKDEGVFIIIGIAILSVIVGSVKFAITKFYIKDNIFILEKGSLIKKKLEIPFNKINTVDQEQNIIDRIFNVCSLKIDSGANKLSGEEVRLQLSLIESESLKALLLKDKLETVENDIKLNVEIEEKYKYERVANVKDIFMYGITKNKLIGTASFIFIILGILSTLNEVINYDFFSSFMDYAQNSTSEFFKTKITIMLFVVIILLGSYIAINIITIIFESVRLYNFTIKSDNKKIYISYGLIKTKHYTLAMDKIHALKLNQTLIQQYLNLYSIEATAIGYGDEKNEKALLFPIANKELLEDIIENILPSFKENLVKTKQNKKAVQFNIILGVFIYIIAALIFRVIFSDINSKVILIGLITISIIFTIIMIMNYNNTSLAANNNLLYISKGSFIKQISIIKQSSIQSVSVFEGPVARKIGVARFIIGIYTNKILEVVTIDNMQRKLEEHIVSYLDM